MSPRAHERPATDAARFESWGAVAGHQREHGIVPGNVRHENTCRPDSGLSCRHGHTRGRRRMPPGSIPGGWGGTPARAQRCAGRPTTREHSLTGFRTLVPPWAHERPATFAARFESWGGCSGTSARAQRCAGRPTTRNARGPDSGLSCVLGGRRADGRRRIDSDRQRDTGSTGRSGRDSHTRTPIRPNR